MLPETTDDGFEFNYIDIGSVCAADLSAKPRRIQFGAAPSSARRIIRSGDTIISTVRTYLKAIWHANNIRGNFIASTGFAVLTPRKNTLPKFVSYLVKEQRFIDRATSESTGTTYPTIAESRLGAIYISHPPLHEQTAIVRYLDYAGHRIRKCIRAKKRLIKLLDEKKQAIIHNAVTRGLDPDVPLKDSGVEWLGKVPAHWEIARLRNVVEMRVSNVNKHVIEGETPVRLCNYVDVYKNSIIHHQMEFMRATATSEEIKRFHLKKNDVLITKDSETWDDIGVPALVGKTAPDLVLGYHLALLRPYTHKIASSYLFYILASKGMSYQFHVGAKGVTRYGLSHAEIKSVRLLLPPLSEQTAIAKYLDKTITAIDAAAARTRREIKLLREYQTRLISDAVTGKINVRKAAEKLPNETKKYESFGNADDAMTDDDDATEDLHVVPESSKL